MARGPARARVALPARYRPPARAVAVGASLLAQLLYALTADASSCPDGYAYGITLPSLCFRNDVAPDSSGISCSQWCRAEATSAGGGCGASGNEHGNCCSGSNCEAGDAYQRFGASLSLVRGKGSRRPTLAVGAPGSGECWPGASPSLSSDIPLNVLFENIIYDRMHI